MLVSQDLTIVEEHADNEIKPARISVAVAVSSPVPNDRIQTFNYDYSISKDKPSAISDSRLNSDGNILGQSGTFVRSSLLYT